MERNLLRAGRLNKRLKMWLLISRRLHQTPSEPPMGWPYHFVDLNDEQKDRRRQLLDHYARLAQLSNLIPLVIAQISFASKRLWGPDIRRVRKERGSPLPANFHPRSNNSLSTIWRKLAWWLGGPIASGWGSRREWIIAGLWTAWLLILVVRDTGEDYLHLTKRFGIVAASQLPVHYLLSVKTPWSPIQYQMRMSHKQLNPYHRLLGRILVTFFTLHATLYLNFFTQTHLLLARLLSPDVLLGLLSLATLLTLITTTLARIRHHNYRLFYTLHLTLSLAILPPLYFHAPPLRSYILSTALIYLLNRLHRFLSPTPPPHPSPRIPHPPPNSPLHLPLSLTPLLLPPSAPPPSPQPKSTSSTACTASSPHPSPPLLPHPATTSPSPPSTPSPPPTSALTAPPSPRPPRAPPNPPPAPTPASKAPPARRRISRIWRGGV
ncbi:MAG: hypothetical protein FRX48_08167 [Lasallia pustulata]|uniref:Ferric oxidoreductase domain-containing protein n=1 Tax=Lasallia pustulata TaxID=136370 RepID=A0A5M8PFW6_9LECA|nr:MAG: hypothetical protein FRX48_08167 [Lasallia pustulata]